MPQWGRSSQTDQTVDWDKLADRLDSYAGKITQGTAFGRVAATITCLERELEISGKRSSWRHSATGIPTREPLLQQMEYDGNGILGVICFIDFDRLCAFDPALGNQLLQVVAQRLKGMLPAAKFLAHVDRAHLAIWFGPDATESSALAEMEAIEYALGETVHLGDRAILPKVRSRCTVVQGQDPGTVLAQALAQLTLLPTPACQTNGVRTSGASERDVFGFEQDLRHAIARNELRLCYQPLIDAANARIFGAEALIRWQNEKLGPVSPAMFVPVMEEIGLAHEFGLWALNVAVRDTQNWQNRGLTDLRVAVNVSGHQLEREDLPTLIGRTLLRHGLSPSLLEIELTEGVAMVDCERAAKLFAEIRAMGVAIAIDDFGTGYSSLSTLRKLAFDKIKIDREFVTEVDRRKDSQAICQSIIALARGLGIRVLAEGLERPEEFVWLRRHGCNLFQGFYFSPPLEREAFASFVENPTGLRAKIAHDAGTVRKRLEERLAV